MHYVVYSGGINDIFESNIYPINQDYSDYKT